MWPEKVTAADVVLDGAEVVLVGHRSTQWYSGATRTPPMLLPAPGRRAGASAVRGAVGEVLDGVRAGQEVGVEQIVALFRRAWSRGGAPSPSSPTSCATVAVGDDITWVHNRNINYTNVCTFKCRFCGFSKGPLSLNLRGTPYLLTLDDIAQRAAEAWEMGATEVTLQGGIHPDFDGDYYIDVTRAVKDAVPDMHVHGFTALEVTEGARRLGEDLVTYLQRLKDAGLASLPGTAAEILDDDVRAVLCPDKINSEEWLDCHAAAHEVGLRSNITIMFGSIEQPESWATHIVRTRELQKVTGGFTEFVGLPFVHMASPIYLQRMSRRGPTFRETLLMHAVARIAYRGLIDNIQLSWVKIGAAGAVQMLRAGCNDLGGTLMDENISRAAGAAHGQGMTESDVRRRSSRRSVAGCSSGARSTSAWIECRYGDVVRGRRSEVLMSTAAEARAAASSAAGAAGLVVDAVAAPAELDLMRATMKDVWGPEIVPPRNLLRGLALSGASLLVARRDDEPIGFALGWLGWDGGVHFHSHQVGVRAHVRGGGIGFALKLAQRAECLEHGVTEMRWTYDPLLFANARVQPRAPRRPGDGVPAPLLRRSPRRVQHRRPDGSTRGDLAARRARRRGRGARVRRRRVDPRAGRLPGAAPRGARDGRRAPGEHRCRVRRGVRRGWRGGRPVRRRLCDPRVACGRSAGSGERARTPISGTKNRCPTIERPRKDA